MFADRRRRKTFWASLTGKRWVILPDGRLGVVDHVKADRRLGVRPVDTQQAAFYPNASQHWSLADRLAIPEEHALTENEIEDALPEQIPVKLGGQWL